MRDDKQNLISEIEKQENLFRQLVLACQEKENADTQVLRVMDEMIWEMKGDPERHARLEEARSYLEMLKAMSSGILEEEEARLNYLIENLKDEADRMPGKSGVYDSDWFSKFEDV